MVGHIKGIFYPRCPLMTLALGEKRGIFGGMGPLGSHETLCDHTKIRVPNFKTSSVQVTKSFQLQQVGPPNPKPKPVWQVKVEPSFIYRRVVPWVFLEGSLLPPQVIKGFRYLKWRCRIILKGCFTGLGIPLHKPFLGEDFHPPSSRWPRAAQWLMKLKSCATKANELPTSALVLQPWKG